VIVVAVAALLMWIAHVEIPASHFEWRGARAVALLIAYFGASLVSAAVLTFNRAKTTVNPTSPQDTSVIVTHGAYRYTRNPMYLGFALILLAWGVLLTNFVSLVCVAFFVWYIDRFQIRPEERALHAKFGNRYKVYCWSVRRWL